VFALISCGPSQSPKSENHGHSHGEGEEDHAHPHPEEKTGAVHSHGEGEEDHAHPHPEEKADAEHSHGESGDDHGHAHGDEPKIAQITLWSDRFELFIEHPVPVVNSPVQFITHVTDLVTLEPRRDGPVTFVLRSPSGERGEHLERRPSRAGIYLPDIRFTQAGKWEVSLRIPLENQEFLIELPAITVYANENDAAHAPDVPSFDGISFLKEQQWKVLSKTEEVQRRALAEEMRLTGVVRPSPGRRALVTPPAEGRLMRSSSNTLPFIGDIVEAGQELAVLRPVAASPLQSLALELEVKTSEVVARIQSAEATLAEANLAYNRAAELFEKKAKSAREVEEALSAKTHAQAELTAARSLLESIRSAGNDLHNNQTTRSTDDGLPALSLKAPIRGRIVSVDATEGEFVRPENPLFTILDTESVLIEARVPESAVSQIRPDLGASYALPDTSGQTYAIADSGRFVMLGSEVESATRTVPLFYEVKNPNELLKVGMALTVHVETGRSEDAIVVPVSALVEEDGNAIAFVQVSGETFERRDLTLGLRTAEFVQVLAGLSSGERVVTKGAYPIRLASVSSVIPAHGHAH